ncbi:MAG: EF-hand domain-containing protein [Oceanospirillaceae bacterium]|nr:EF-hand domain-containing protein [Oceanospirillaceae bacterium]
MKKLLAISVLSMTAMFVQAGETEQAVFEQLDTDSNGLISETEAKVLPELMPFFVDLDIDKDGQLSLVEYELISKR